MGRMMKANTLNGLRASISRSSRVKNILLESLENKARAEIRLNLVYLTYDFASRKVLLQYYVKDDKYPDVEISFDDFVDFIDLTTA